MTQSAPCSFQVGTSANGTASRAGAVIAEHAQAAGVQFGDDARGGDGADIRLAGDDVGDAIERAVENADHRRVDVAAGLLDELGQRNVIGIAERGRQRDGDAAAFA